MVFIACLLFLVSLNLFMRCLSQKKCPQKADTVRTGCVQLLTQNLKVYVVFFLISSEKYKV